jgi:AcrR family transcriptional regulator
MPRKRTITDEVLLDRALLVAREVGPDGLTFGAVAERAGLAASTIVQRFGTKPALLRAGSAPARSVHRRRSRRPDDRPGVACHRPYGAPGAGRGGPGGANGC